MFDINNIRAEFPILSTKFDNKTALVYLDSGATAQKPQCVIDKISELYCLSNSNIHRGVHRLSSQATAMYEDSRDNIREYIGAKSYKEIIFTSGATASINLVAYSWGEAFITNGDEIIVSEMEHHSNIVPWQALCQRKGAVLRVLPFNDNGELEVNMLDSLLSSKTKLVAITAASNVLGTMPNLKPIIKKAHDFGALVMVDGCQAIVHSKVDVVDLDCDFYAFSGHKLYAPTGIGVLYAKENLLEKMPPFMLGGDMVATVSFEKTTYAELPLKFEAGTSNFIGAIALCEAINFVKRIGIESIHNHEKMLLDYATKRMKEIDNLTIYGNSQSKCSIVSFNIDGIHHLDIGMILDKMGIAVRTGTHCAEPVMKHYGISGMVRASFAMYNTVEEIDKLIDGIKKASKMLL